MAKKLSNDLGYLGEEAQTVIIKNILEDPVTFSKLYGVVEQNAFTVQEYRDIVGSLRDYYNKYGSMPTYKSLQVLIRSKFKDNEIETETHLAYLEKIEKADNIDRDLVVDEAVRFFKQQRFVYYWNKAKEAIEKGYKDATVQTCIDNLNTILNSDVNDAATNPLDFIEETLEKEKEVLVPTGIKELDQIMNGGHPKGSFGIIQGNAGCGKTTIATILASNAAAAGFKTLQIFFEDREVDIYRKHYAYMCPKLSINDFINPLDIEWTEEKIKENPNYEALHNNLQILRLETGECTMEDIAFEVRKLANMKGFVPDMIIIDYFDCIKPSENPFRDKLEGETRLARKLENFAKKNNVALWVMHQGNRSGENETGATTIQGSYSKKQIAQTYITMYRTKEDRINNRAIISFEKTRSFGAKEDLNVYFDNGAMIFDASDRIHTNPKNELTDDDVYNNPFKF